MGVGNYCYVASARGRGRRWGALGEDRGGAYRVKTKAVMRPDKGMLFSKVHTVSMNI